MQAARAPVVKQHQFAFLNVAVESEWQVHHRILQTLAHPHRHDLDGRGVAIDPAVAFGSATAILALAAQPVSQRRKGIALPVGDLLQQLRHVGQVGHVPLALLPRQHAVAHTAQLRGFEDGGHPPLAGVVRPLPQGLCDAIGERIAAAGKIVGGLAEEHRRGGGAHDPGAMRLVERLQQR